jgi:hypothetical protein
VDTGKAVIMTSSSFRRQAPGRAYDFLPPEPAKRESRRSRAADVADAEFVVIGSGRPYEPHGLGFNDNLKPTLATVSRPSPPVRLASSLARVGEAWLQRASAKGFAALVLAFCILVFGLSGGFSGLARPDAVDRSSPLHFTHVTATPRDANGMRVLLINGIIDNVSGTTQLVRPIRHHQPVGGCDLWRPKPRFFDEGAVCRWKNAGSPAVLLAVRGVSRRRLW